MLKSLLFPILLATSTLYVAPLHAESKLAQPKAPVLTPSIAPYLEDNTIAGAVLAVATPDKLLAVEASGFADLAQKRAMNEDDLFWIASMTKPITAIAVMMLVEEGKLDLDEPLGTYLPEFMHMWKTERKDRDQLLLVRPKRTITARHLLTHTSGLINKSPLDGDALDVLSLKEAVITYGLSPLKFEPGTEWNYNNPGINTLGRLIEVVSGMSYTDFLQQRIFTPLGMKDTTFWPNEAQLKRLAKSYTMEDKATELSETTVRFLTPPYSNTKRAPLAAGGLFSTARDLAKLYQMLLNEGSHQGTTYLKKGTLAEMLRNQVGDLKAGFVPGMHMGLGFQVVNEPKDVTKDLHQGSFGHGGAYGTQGWIDPVKKRAYILLIQRQGLKNSDASAVRQSFQEAGAKLP